MFTPKINAAEAAAISVNVSLRNPIAAETLVGIFKGTHAADAWLSHLALFFSDVPDAILGKFIVQNGLSSDDMLKIFYLLAPCMQHKRFLDILPGLTQGRPSSPA